MKLVYSTPDIKIISFCAIDLLSASTEYTPGEDELPIIPLP